MKTLIALAVAAAVLASTGCCLPLHGHRQHRYDGWSDGSSRQAQPSRHERDGRDRYRR